MLWWETVWPHRRSQIVRREYEERAIQACCDSAFRAVRRLDGRDIFSVTALSRRLPIPSKAGAGPDHWSSSTLVKSGISVLRVARVRKRSASLRCRSKVSASVAEFVTLSCQSREEGGIDSMCPNFANTVAVDFAPHPARPG